MANPIVNWTNYSNSAVVTGTTATIGSTQANGMNGSIASGDLLIAVLAVLTNGAGDPASAAASMTSAGFTAITNGDLYNSGGTEDWRTYVGLKIAGASESGIYTASWSASAVGVAWALIDISPASATQPDAGDGVATTALQTSAPAPSVSPTGSADLLLNIYTTGSANNGVFTLPNTTVLQTPGRAFNTPLIGVSSLQLSSSGSTGAQNASFGTDTNPSSGFSIAIAPASGGGGGSPTDDIAPRSGLIIPIWY